MNRLAILCLAIAQLCSCSVLVQAQTPKLTIVDSKVDLVDGLAQPKVIGQYVIVGANSSPKMITAAMIFVESDGFKSLDVEAESLPDFQPVDLIQIDEKTYLLVGTGRYAVTAYGFDPVFKRARKFVELGPPPPPPPPPKPVPPPVPDDAFDNLGRRVAAAATTLPRTADVAALYRAAAVKLTSDPSVTINSVIEQMVVDRTKLLEPAIQSAYKPLIDMINGDMKARWPMDKRTFSLFLTAIAAGLEAVK